MNDAQERISTGIALGSTLNEPEALKHLEIDRAINDQYAVVIRLGALLHKIHPIPQPDGAAAGIDRSQPSLVEVLDQAPERIRGNTQRMLNKIDELENLLF